MSSLPELHRYPGVNRAATLPLLHDCDQDATVKPRETPPAQTNAAASQPEFNNTTDLPNELIPEAHSQAPEGLVDRQSSEPCQTAVESISGPRRSVFSSSETKHLRDVQYGSIDLLSPWFPEVDPSNERAQTWRTWHSRQDILLATAATIATFVFLVNLAATIATQTRFKPNNGVVSMYEGSCSLVKKVDTMIHIFINLLSTLLLGASNLCMQILAAPTRRETDKAHRKKRWLDIGIPSWRNLRSISRSRLVVWCCLGLSSVPIHFMYNSAFSISIPRYSYTAAVVSENFFYGAPSVLPDEAFPWAGIWPPDRPPINYAPLSDFSNILSNLSNIAFDDSKAENLTTMECLKTYADAYGPRTNMLMVTQDDPASTGGSLLQYVYIHATWHQGDIYWPCLNGTPGYNMECGRPDKFNKNLLDHWSKFGRKVLYCISQKRAKDHCRLNYSPTIMIVVCCFSLVKCICISCTTIMLRLRPESTLCTLGDAISSFLENTDEETRDLGIVTKASIDQNKSWRSAKASPWRPSVSRWYASASNSRWAFTTFVCVTAIIGAMATMASGSHGTMVRLNTHSFKLVLGLGFGSPNPNEFTAYFLGRHGTKGFIENVIWANYWQMVISLLYLAYNALLTCQLVAEEWSGYAKQRKTLRVSHPKGVQRSSYFVSMPMKYGITLMTANATLHWLVSQSIFLVSTTTYFPDDSEDTLNSYTTTGYSISASLASICFGVFMFIIILLNSFRTLPKGIPLVSTCSAAISAACHPPTKDIDAYLLPVQWGVIPSEGKEILRCSFTTYRDVQPPEVGELYLGLPTPSLPTPSLPTPNYIRRAWRWLANCIKHCKKI